MAKMVYKDGLFHIRYDPIIFNFDDELNPQYWDRYPQPFYIADGKHIPKFGLISFKITDPNAQLFVNDYVINIGHIPFLRIYSSIIPFCHLQLNHKDGVQAELHAPIIEFYPNLSFQRIGDKFLVYNVGIAWIRDELYLEKNEQQLLRANDKKRSTTFCCITHADPLLRVYPTLPKYCRVEDEDIIFPKRNRLAFENWLRKNALQHYLHQITYVQEELDEDEKRELTRERAREIVAKYDKYIQDGFLLPYNKKIISSGANDESP